MTRASDAIKAARKAAEALAAANEPNHGPSDQALQVQVARALVRRGMRFPCRIAAQAALGEITLAGTVQFAHQKTSAVEIASAIAGVLRVIDDLTVATTPDKN